jgi:hypothetical protein
MIAKITIIIMMIKVVKRITARQLNIILQIPEICEAAVGVGKRAGHVRIAVQIPTHTWNWVQSSISSRLVQKSLCSQQQQQRWLQWKMAAELLGLIWLITAY